MYIQTRPFNQNKGGSKKGWCLQNVRLGYDIGPKYATAWQAWQNSPQFTSVIPMGVSVPVYFWWGRDGHIGVQLPDGRFWSDGIIYSSLSRYRLTHPTVIYRGWSTHVNGVEVIKLAPQTQKMPPVGSKIQLLPKDKRTTFRAGTTTVAGVINVTDNTFVYTVHGYDPKFPNRVIINSKSAGGNGVALSLYYLSGQRIKGWTVK
jgi:hypothetical protein